MLTNITLVQVAEKKSQDKFLEFHEFFDFILQFLIISFFLVILFIFFQILFFSF